jgi:hypothetical protein
MNIGQVDKPKAFKVFRETFESNLSFINRQTVGFIQSASRNQRKIACQIAQRRL